MKLETTRQGDTTILRLFGELTADSVPRFHAATETALAEQSRDFVVDMEAVTALDSAGLEALTALQRRCEEQLGMVRLCNVGALHRKILELTRLDKILFINGSMEEALSNLLTA